MRPTPHTLESASSDHTMVGAAMLAAIDAGRLVEIIAPDTPELWLAAAEIAAAVGDEAAALESIRLAGDVSPELRLRASCIRAELAIASGDVASAVGIAYDVLAAALAAGDHTAVVRARMALVRSQVREGSYRAAVDDIPRLRREIDDDATATDEQRQFRTAICDHLEAYSRLKLGDGSAALTGAHRAIGRFVAIGATRWEAWARNVVGLALFDAGEQAAALHEFQRSEAVASRIDNVSAMLQARNNAAMVLMSQGRLLDAIESLRGTMAMRGAMPAVPDVHALHLAAVCYGTLDRTTEARSCAREAVALADELGHDEMGATARIVAAWLDRSFDRLHNLKVRAEQRGLRWQVRAALVFMADVTSPARTPRANRLLATADDLTEHDDELSELVRRIRARLAASPISLDGDRLTIDLTRGIPRLDDAIEAVERLLTDVAMRRGEFVQRAAARLLDLTPTRLQNLRRKLDATGTDSER